MDGKLSWLAEADHFNIKFPAPKEENLIATYHNHSTWSDGRSSVEEIYRHAWDSGVGILGISDHVCLRPDGKTPCWEMNLSQIDTYMGEILALRDKGPVEIRVGLEVDWFDGRRDAIAAFLDPLALDYRIGSIHFVDNEEIDGEASYWIAKSQDQIDETYAKYWGLVRGMAESRLFDIAGHLDLPKKFGFYPKADMGPHIDKALDAIAASGMVVELNMAGLAKPCAEAYPALDILKKCRSRKIPVTLSSDAHQADHIAYGFARGCEILEDAGFAEVTRFRERKRWVEPLAEAIKPRRS